MSNSLSISFLDWDSNFFGFSCGSVTLSEQLDSSEWDEFLGELKKNNFVTIKNLNSNPFNAYLISKTTDALLVDINVQFILEIREKPSISRVGCISNFFEYDHRIIQITSFKYSRFFLDPRTNSFNPERIYYEWLKNSFNKETKFFIISEHEKDLRGYILFTINSGIATIELIMVNPKFSGQGVGTLLFSDLKSYLFSRSIFRIKVGTQFRNIEALNFYSKMGGKIVEMNQIFHLWNNVD